MIPVSEKTGRQRVPIYGRSAIFEIMVIWDAHAHYPKLNRETATMLQLPENLMKVFLTGSHPEDWDRLEALQKNPSRWIPSVPDHFFEIAFGLHPWWIDEKIRSGEEGVLRHALATLPQRLKRAVALGELGLDYFKKRDPQGFSLQRELFDAQLLMAQDLKLPIVLHVVQAHTDALEALRRHAVGHSWKGIVHSFSGDVSIAEKYLNLGLKLSLSPRWLREKSHKLSDAVRALPLESFVIESDSDSEGLLSVASEIARLHDQSVDHVWEVNRANLESTFFKPQI